MEALLLLIPLGLLAAFAGGGGDDDDDEREATADNDILEGGNGAQEISALEGNDLVFGGEDGDTLLGNEGSDVLVGDSGNDALSGQAGSDLLIGGTGDDTLNGGDDGDSLVSGPGNDELYGGQGSDELIGLSGRDTLFGGDGDDFIIGYDAFNQGDADDIVSPLAELVPGVFAEDYGDDGAAQVGRVQEALAQSSTNRAPDVLDGGDGDDTLFGDTGDTITGGTGTDEFNVFVEFDGDPQQITDFDTAAETMFLLVDGLTGQQITFTDGGVGAEVRVDGTVVAVLQGLLAAQVDPNSVVLQDIGPL